jgi:flagellar biosynthetic protein FlhB
VAQEHRSQRTERPTARRLSKARERGQVARSREIPGVAVLGALLLFGQFFGPRWLERLEGLMAAALGGAGRVELDPVTAMPFLAAALGSAALLLAPPLGALTLAGLAGNLIQGAPPFSLEPLRPKLDRLNPLGNLRRVVSLRQWVELLKGVIKMALYGAVAYSAARGVILGETFGRFGAEGTLRMLLALSATVLLHVTALAAALALLDWLFRRYDHLRELKMSKREIREEHKETEGDPTIRARIRRKQLALARSRMMAEVSRATVVVTNPEHFAVALRWVAGESAAPKLVAKGRGRIAERIRALAREHRVPIVSDPPLARALYRAVALGAEIPTAFFRAVAEVLALVLAGRRRPSAAAAGAREVRR